VLGSLCPPATTCARIPAAGMIITFRLIVRKSARLRHAQRDAGLGGAGELGINAGRGAGIVCHAPQGRSAAVTDGA